MTSSERAVTEPPASTPSAVAVEAARYALLRRLTPSMRHHLVVNLQPIGMIYEIMDRRLKAPNPDLGDVHESAHKINGFARAALDSCLNVVGWLAPDGQARSEAADGVRECLGLLATSLTFRGYALRNEVQAMPGEVRRSAIRNVLTAAILHATDHTDAPAEILISAERTVAGLVITLTLRPTEGAGGFDTHEIYRQLEWADVQALAESESVSVERRGHQQFTLSIPWVN